MNPLPMSRMRVVFLCGSFCLLLLLLTGAVVGRTRSSEKTYRSLKIFNETLHYVQSNYVERVNADQLMEGAYRGLLASLDSDSEYLPPTEASRKDKSGGLADVGITPVRRGLIMRVLSVRPDSPAAKAGIEAGWYLRLIEKRSARELSPFRVRQLLSGPEGSTIHCAFMKPGDPKKIEFDLERALPPQEALQVSELRPDLVHLRLLRVDEAGVKQMRRALQQISTDSRVLLDLRNNPGGLYEEAARIANLFIPEGVMARLRGREEELRVFEARPRDRVWEGEVVVLVDRGTAGAAELIAAALQGRERGRLLGEKTAGVGSYQESLPLPDGGTLRLSVAKYQSPGSEPWHGKGLSPDEVLERPVELEEAGDWLLEGALRLLSEPAQKEAA